MQCCAYAIVYTVQCSSAQIHLYIYGNGSGDGDNVLSDCRYGVTIVQLYCPTIVFQIHLHELCVHGFSQNFSCTITEFNSISVRIKFHIYDKDTSALGGGRGSASVCVFEFSIAFVYTNVYRR